ncbi:putative minus-end-directed kinesin ATPase [Helianthus debilis subsp. tardiflorus]
MWRPPIRCPPPCYSRCLIFFFNKLPSPKPRHTPRTRHSPVGGSNSTCQLMPPTQAPPYPRSDPAASPDRAALSAYKYFENARNFLVAVEQMGLHTFEASDLEQGGKTSRIVNCVLTLKPYSLWKQTSGHGIWRFGGVVKLSTPSKGLFAETQVPSQILCQG